MPAGSATPLCLGFGSAFFLLRLLSSSLRLRLYRLRRRSSSRALRLLSLQ